MPTCIPGNILVSVEPATGRYIALDFGIMGTLTDCRQALSGAELPRLLPPRLQARRRGAHRIRLGAAETRVDEFESAIRAVCEPIFDRPLKDISFGRVLLRLFQTSRRFDIEIQPQLVLLQKTLLNIEGLGRQLDPELDLWKTAKPWLERWMTEQVGWRGLIKRLQAPRRRATPTAAATAAPGAPGADAGSRTAAAKCRDCWSN